MAGQLKQQQQQKEMQMINRMKLSRAAKELWGEVVWKVLTKVDWKKESAFFSEVLSAEDFETLEAMSEDASCMEPPVERSKHSGEPDYLFEFDKWYAEVYVLKPLESVDLSCNSHPFCGGEHGSLISVEYHQHGVRWYETYPFDKKFLDWMTDNAASICRKEVVEI